MLVNLKTPLPTICHNELPFNLGCTNQWFNQQSAITNTRSHQLDDWLFDQGSLTQRLQSHCDTFEVLVLREGISDISLQERALFTGSDIINSREVLLLCDGQPQVYARTLIPQNTLQYANALLKTLGNKSLGEVLFSAKNMQRQPIEITSFDQDSAITTLASALSLQQEHPLWARRSMFTLDQYPLLVSEVFLPKSYPYTTETK